MSIKLMARIWDTGPEDMAERFVLLAIADHANDDGTAYPSAATIARKTCMDDRSVRRITKRLADAGWLQVDLNAGPRGCNVFTVRTPDLGSGGPRVRVTEDPATPDLGSGDPLTEGQGNHHLTIKEPSERAREASPPALPDAPAAPPPSKRKEKRATQMGEWFPDEALMDWAASTIGVSAVEARKELDKFRDHHLAKGSAFKDWDAAWRNWARREGEFRQKDAARKRR